MVKFFTSNPNKLKQYARYLDLEAFYVPEQEEKWPIPEMVVYRKVLKASQHTEDMVVADDRALYLTPHYPGPDIKCFVKNPSPGKGYFVFSLAYGTSEEVHVFSRAFPVKIAPGKGTGAWGKLEGMLYIPPFEKPYAQLSRKEKEIIERRLEKQLFRPFFQRMVGNGKAYSRQQFQTSVINAFFKSLEHQPLEYLWNIVQAYDYPLTVKRRTLLSLAYYPIKHFFEGVDVRGTLLFHVPRGRFKERSRELIEEILDFHHKRYRPIPELEKIEKEESLQPQGHIVKGPYLRRGKELIPLQIREILPKDEIFERMHYLESARNALFTYGLFMEEKLVAIMAVSEVEREYKKRLLKEDGVRALEISRAYSALNAKGVLSYMAAYISKKHGRVITAYQPSFAEGSSIFAAGFSPYIIKPQQNFYRMEKYPVFVVRRELKGNEERGKMPLLPSLDLMRKPITWMHFLPSDQGSLF